MPSMAYHISQDIVSYLDAQITNVSFIAERENLARIKAEAATRTLVFVTPVGLVQQKDTRGEWVTLYEFQLSVVQQLQFQTIEEEDALMELAESLPLLLDLPATFGGAVLWTVEDDAARAAYEVQALETAHVFYARIAVVFRLGE